jgi:hypothetical protein
MTHRNCWILYADVTDSIERMQERFALVNY